jgi:two-component system cell cycle sensor histidine kinase PleC
LSAIEAGLIRLDEEEVAADAPVLQSVALLGPRPERAGVRLEVDPTSPGFRLRGDERRLRQVLVNLLTNAVKFTPPGGVVRVAGQVLVDGRAGFVISDTGIGMTAAEIRVARERFGCVGDVLTHPHDGAGLGIPLAIGLMATHGGVLHIESEKGAGTTVSAVLPANRVIGGLQYNLIPLNRLQQPDHPAVNRDVCAAE